MIGKNCKLPAIATNYCRSLTATTILEAELVVYLNVLHVYMYELSMEEKYRLEIVYFSRACVVR